VSFVRGIGGHRDAGWRCALPEEESQAMAEKRIDQLREILVKAAARDRELQRTLEALAADVLEELGGDNKLPVWAEIKAGEAERQVNPHFVMQDGWLRGDLVFEVAPDTKLMTSLRMRTTKNKTHEVGLATEMSYSMLIDPDDEKDREGARKKLFGHIFGSLEGQVRRRVGLPVE
jgi:hypothetical protein